MPPLFLVTLYEPIMSGVADVSFLSRVKLDFSLDFFANVDDKLIYEPSTDMTLYDSSFSE